MSSAIDQIVNIQIDQQTTAVPQTGFGVPLILGSSSVISPDVIRYYTDTASMLADGWSVNDPEYKKAVAAFSQALTPDQVGIGRRLGGSMASDIAAIQAVSDIWYGLSLTSSVAQDILDAAAYIETQKKIYVACSHDAAVPTTATGDVLSELKALGYNRTALIFTFTSGNAAAGPDSGWLGGQLPQVPGSSTWKFKQLVGVAPDAYTGTQRNIMIGTPGVPGKNGNIYETVGGVNITEEGWMVSGKFIDITVGIDWLESTMQTNVYSLLVANPKIPYTDQGAAVIQNAVFQTIQQGVANGLIDGGSPITVEVPTVLSVSQTLRAERVFEFVTFECRLSGAFHFIKIKGTVTV
jgi:hypothetical protein